MFATAEMSRLTVAAPTAWQGMFYSADKFNQDIGKWDVGKVSSMSVSHRAAA